MLTILNARHTKTAFRRMEITELLRYLTGLPTHKNENKSRANEINVVDGSAEQKTFAHTEGPLNHKLGQ